MQIPFWCENNLVYYISPKGSIDIKIDTDGVSKVCDCTSLSWSFLNEYLHKDIKSSRVCYYVCSMLRYALSLQELNDIIAFCTRSGVRYVKEMSLSSLGLTLDDFNFNSVFQNNLLSSTLESGKREYVLGTSGICHMVIDNFLDLINRQIGRYVLRTPLTIWTYDGKGVREINLPADIIILKRVDGIQLPCLNNLILTNVGVVSYGFAETYTLKVGVDFDCSIENETIRRAILGLANKGELSRSGLKTGWIYQKRKAELLVERAIESVQFASILQELSKPKVEFRKRDKTSKMFDFIVVTLSCTSRVDIPYVKKNRKLIDRCVLQAIKRHRTFQKSELSLNYFKLGSLRLTKDGVLEYVFECKLD